MTSEHTERPFILVVDDEADGLKHGLALALNDRVELVVRHPQDVTPQDLGRVNLVLMDYRLDDWPRRSDQRAAFNIRNGLALATVFKEIADQEANGRLTAVALHTAHLTDVSGRIRAPHSRHVVAQLNNLEWVFEKSDQHRYDGVVQLARAAQSLQADWPTDPSASEARARQLLDLDGQTAWAERAWRAVRECQPPVYELGGGPRGVFFLRWLLHRILPYPCFLWDVNWVAACLRISVGDLKRLVASDCDLARDIERLKYTGLMAGFLGDRWWRTAMEDYAWELGGQSAGNSGEFKRQLSERAGGNLKLVAPRDPVVCLNHDLLSAGIASPHDAVRLRPDYWPSFADAAWMAIDDVRHHSEFRAMVDPLDDYRVDSDA